MSLETRVTATICRLTARHYMKRPDMADFLHTKFFTFAGMGGAVRNELAFRAGRPCVPAVRMAAFELTNACNLTCRICPVNAGMERPKGYMDVDLYRGVLEANPALEIVQLCLWGEPTLHPRLFDFIDLAAGRGIRSYFYTNATRLDDDMIDRLLWSGLHRIFFSLDGFGETYTRIRGVDYGEVEAAVFRFLHRREAENHPIRVGVAMVANGETEGLVAAFRERWEPLVDEVQITPHITHRERERATPCRLLWLGYPIVLWDGTVVPCCVDTEGTLALGDVHGERDLLAVWNGGPATAMRRDHVGMRFRGVCRTCHEYRSDDIRPRFDE
jgi:hypothetical protein